MSDLEAFVAGLPEERRAEVEALCALMTRATGEEPALWGSSIIGFGRYHYRYASGREGDYCATGFSPRKAGPTLYVMDGFSAYAELLGRLGPHKTAKSCLYLKRLDDVDLEVLEEIVRRSYRQMRDHPPGANAT